VLVLHTGLESAYLEVFSLRARRSLPLFTAFHNHEYGELSIPRRVIILVMTSSMFNVFASQASNQTLQSLRNLMFNVLARHGSCLAAENHWFWSAGTELEQARSDFWNQNMNGDLIFGPRNGFLVLFRCGIGTGFEVFEKMVF
jgi:hypothetical protein